MDRTEARRKLAAAVGFAARRLWRMPQITPADEIVLDLLVEALARMGQLYRPAEGGQATAALGSAPPHVVELVDRLLPLAAYTTAGPLAPATSGGQRSYLEKRKEKSPAGEPAPVTPAPRATRAAPTTPPPVAERRPAAAAVVTEVVKHEAMVVENAMDVDEGTLQAHEVMPADTWRKPSTPEEAVECVMAMLPIMKWVAAENGGEPEDQLVVAIIERVEHSIKDDADLDGCVALLYGALADGSIRKAWTG